MLWIWLASLPVAGLIYVALRLGGYRPTGEWERGGLWALAGYKAMLGVLIFAVVLIVAALVIGFWDATQHRSMGENLRVGAKSLILIASLVFFLRTIELRPLPAVVVFVAAIVVTERLL